MEIGMKIHYLHRIICIIGFTVLIDCQASEKIRYVYDNVSYTYTPNELFNNSIRNRIVDDVMEGEFVFDKPSAFLTGHFKSNVRIGEWEIYEIPNLRNGNYRACKVRQDIYSDFGTLQQSNEYSVYKNESILTRTCTFGSQSISCSYPKSRIVYWYLKYFLGIILIWGLLLSTRLLLNFGIARKREVSFWAASAVTTIVFYWKQTIDDSKRIVQLANIFNSLFIIWTILVVVFHLIIKSLE